MKFILGFIIGGAVVGSIIWAALGEINLDFSEK